MIVKLLKSEAKIKYEDMNETGKSHNFCVNISTQRFSIRVIPCLTCYIKLLSKSKYANV